VYRQFPNAVQLANSTKNDAVATGLDIIPQEYQIHCTFVISVTTKLNYRLSESLSVIRCHCLKLSSGERTGRRLLWSTTLLLPTLLSDSQVSISLVIHGLWWTVSGQVKAHVVLTCTNAVSPNHLHVPTNKIWRRTESTPRSGWWCSRMAGNYSDCSTRKINNCLKSLMQNYVWVHITSTVTGRNMQKCNS